MESKTSLLRGVGGDEEGMGAGVQGCRGAGVQGCRGDICTTFPKCAWGHQDDRAIIVWRRSL
ncbi:hypothetical protein [Nostoc sp.]|uniref:hypothetical protein n=1 Tax=Nostoc sp. TaxID=1180 RepID=UPI002FF9287E